MIELVFRYLPFGLALTDLLQNIDAEFVSLENVIPLAEGENFSDSDTLGQDFYDRVADLVAERIKQCGNRVPVVTGMTLTSGHAM